MMLVRKSGNRNGCWGIVQGDVALQCSRDRRNGYLTCWFHRGVELEARRMARVTYNLQINLKPVEENEEAGAPKPVEIVPHIETMREAFVAGYAIGKYAPTHNPDQSRDLEAAFAEFIRTRKEQGR